MAAANVKPQGRPLPRRRRATAVDRLLWIFSVQTAAVAFAVAGTGSFGVPKPTGAWWALDAAAALFFGFLWTWLLVNVADAMGDDDGAFRHWRG